MDITWVLIIAVIGLAIGTVSSMTGLGGGSLIVPTLVLVFFLPAQKAVGTSLMVITFTTLSATLAYGVQGRIDYKLGLWLDLLDVPGVIAGAYVTTLLPSRVLASLFGVFLIAVAFYVVKRRDVEEPLSPRTALSGWKRGLTDSSGRRFDYVVRRPLFGLVSSFAGGFAAGMFGVGGGFVDMAAMILVLGIPTHIAIATSMFGMTITAVAGTVTQGAFGNIAFDYAIPLIVGVVCGAQVGSRMATRLESRTLRKIFGVAMVLIGLRMALIYFTA